MIMHVDRRPDLLQAIAWSPNSAGVACYVNVIMSSFGDFKNIRR